MFLSFFFFIIYRSFYLKLSKNSKSRLNISRSWKIFVYIRMSGTQKKNELSRVQICKFYSKFYSRVFIRINNQYWRGKGKISHQEMIFVTDAGFLFYLKAICRMIFLNKRFIHSNARFYARNTQGFYLGMVWMRIDSPTETTRANRDWSFANWDVYRRLLILNQTRLSRVIFAFLNKLLRLCQQCQQWSERKS